MASCENPATDSDALMTRRPKFDRSKECVRCKTRRGNVVIRHTAYCKECFHPMISTKFRKSLEPSVNVVPDGPRRRPLKASGNLLLGLSGGLGSAVLLNLLSQCYFATKQVEESGKGGKDHPRNTSVWPKAAACYVEICSAFPGTRDRTEDVRGLVKNYSSFEFVPLRIEDAFDQLWWTKVGGKAAITAMGIDVTNEDLLVSSLPETTTTADPVASLHSYISNLPTQTAVASTIQTLVRILLLYTARATGSSHLLLGTSLTSLSVSLISSISQGAGFSVREEAQEEWSSTVSVANGPKRANVRINRPLRDIGMKECAIWAWWNGLKVVRKEKLPGGKQGIGALTKDFIVGLERDYPSTVSTIARTCAKLVPKQGTDGQCVLCQRPAQHGVQDWKARISIRSFDETTLPDTSTASTQSLTPLLCYACHTTLTSRSSRGTTNASTQQNSVLPVWIASHLVQPSDGRSEPFPFEDDETNHLMTRVHADDMRSTIAEFLLDENE